MDIRTLVARVMVGSGGAWWANDQVQKKPLTCGYSLAIGTFVGWAIQDLNL